MQTSAVLRLSKCQWEQMGKDPQLPQVKSDSTAPATRLKATTALHGVDLEEELTSWPELWPRWRCDVMTVGVCDLVNCVNSSINIVTCSLNVLQASSVVKDFDAGFVKSVANCAALPSAACNKGRLIYLQDTCSYRFSDGVVWSNDFASTLDNFLIFGWGGGSCGELGNSSISDRSSPVSIVGGFTDWCNLSVDRSSIAIRINGTAWAWGPNAGRFGNNSTVATSSPVSVAGGFTNWCQISTSSENTAAVRTNGTAWSWGANSYGQLGDLTAVAKSSPVSVVGGFTDWCRISSGYRMSAAIRSNGSLWSWGRNFCGVLGNNSTVNTSSPVSVVGGFTDWCDVSASNQVVGVRTGGSAWAWGYNGFGRLGDGTVTNRSSPVSVIGGFSDWCRIDAGLGFTNAIRENGTAWSWGFNGGGRLGNNRTVSTSSPVSVVGGFTDWCDVTAGSLHAGGTRTNASVWTWGCNGNGRLGDNTDTNRSSPVSVSGGMNGWCVVSAGASHTMAIRPSRGF